MASEEQIQRQFRGPSTPELLNADIAPLIKKVGIEIKDFPTLNAPSKVVIEATMQRMRMLDLLDNDGRLTTMGSSKLSFDFSPEWARTLAKAREHGILEGTIKVAAVLSREDELCTMQTMDRYNHPDGDVMSLLQSIELVEGILKTHRVTHVRDLPWNESAVSALEYAGFKPRTVTVFCFDKGGYSRKVQGAVGRVLLIRCRQQRDHLLQRQAELPRRRDRRRSLPVTAL